MGRRRAQLGGGSRPALRAGAIRTGCSAWSTCPARTWAGRGTGTAIETSDSGASVRDRWQALREDPLLDAAERELRAFTFSTDFADRSRARELAERWGYDRFEINSEANAAINAEIEAEDEEELRRRCEGLDVPVLVVHGDADPRPVEGPEALARALPQARLAVLANVGHIPWAEHPEQLRAQLRSFLLAIHS